MNPCSGKKAVKNADVIFSDKVISLNDKVDKNKKIKDFFGKLIDWKNINDLMPQYFKKGLQNKKTCKAGLLAGSLELVKEGNLIIKQDKLFEDIYIKEVK